MTPVHYPHRISAVVLLLGSLLVLWAGIAHDMQFLIGAQLFNTASAVRMFWLPERQDEPRWGLLIAVLLCVLFAGLALIAALESGYIEHAAAARIAEAIATPAGVLVLLAVILFSVIPQIRRERQMRSG